MARITEDKIKMLQYSIVLPYRDFNDRMEKTKKLEVEMRKKGNRYSINVLDNCIMCEFEYPENKLLN